MNFEEIYEKTKPLHILASIVTVSNFIWSVVALETGGVPNGYIPVGNIGIGFISACFLEACLASAFGWAIVFSISKGSGFPVVMAIVIMLISAWTSFFNIQLLILGSAPSSWADIFIMTIIGALFCFCACYLIESHVKKFQIKFSFTNDLIKSLNSEGGLYFWQIICFITMFSIICANANIAT